MSDQWVTTEDKSNGQRMRARGASGSSRRRQAYIAGSKKRQASNQAANQATAVAIAKQAARLGGMDMHSANGPSLST